MRSIGKRCKVWRLGIVFSLDHQEPWRTLDNILNDLTWVAGDKDFLRNMNVSRGIKFTRGQAPSCSLTEIFSLWHYTENSFVDTFHVQP